MTVNTFLSQLFKKDKSKKKSQLHEKKQAPKDVPTPASSQMKSSSSSSSSLIHPVDSHSQLPHVKLARFLEKRHQKHMDDLHALHNNIHNTLQCAPKTPPVAASSSSNFKKTHPSKFNDFTALRSLCSKYGIIPDNSIDLKDLIVHPDDLDVTEAHSPDKCLVIGQGAGGSVYPLYNATQSHLYAMKKMRLKSDIESHVSYDKKLKNEFNIASKFHHQNLIRTYDLLQADDLFIIVMDYAPYDFFTMVMAGQMTKNEAYCYFKQMCKGVQHMHYLGVAHRDLKLDNCVVDKNGILKIVDFGSSVIFNADLFAGHGSSSGLVEKATGIMGSDPYLAPEILSDSFYDPSLADVWSLAIIFCCILLQRFPWKIPKESDISYDFFTRENKETVDQNGQTKTVGPNRLLNLLPEKSRSLISQMLKIKPSERFNIKNVMESQFILSFSECHYDDYDSNRNQGTLVKNDHHSHHLITNKQFEEDQTSTA